MGRTTIAATSILTPVGPYPTLPATALSLDLAFQAADVANLNQFAFGQGRFIILARNVHAVTGYTVTLSSAIDSNRRTGDVTAYALAALKQMAFYIDNTDGWMQTDLNVYLTGSNVSIEFCVLRIP